MPGTSEVSTAGNVQKKFPASSSKEQLEMEPLTTGNKNDEDEDEGYENGCDNNNMDDEKFHNKQIV